MKDKIEGIKSACGLWLLSVGRVMGIRMLMAKDGRGQNHYLYSTSYMDHAVLIPRYLPVYAALHFVGSLHSIENKARGKTMVVIGKQTPVTIKKVFYQPGFCNSIFPVRQLSV